MQKLPRNKVSVSVSIPLDLLTEIDDYAYYENKTRSEFILQAAKEKMAKIQEQNRG